MSRYVGLLALLLGALLVVNFVSDVLSARAVMAQGEREDEPAVAEAVLRKPLPLTGLVRTPTGPSGHGRVLEASATPGAQPCTGPMVSARR
jgi:hypothetical protein